MGFLKFCSVLLNMVCVGIRQVKMIVWCVRVYWHLVVLSTWVLSSIGFSFARTSLCRRDGLFLYAITWGSGKIWLNVLFFWTNFQCFLSIFLSL